MDIHFGWNLIPIAITAISLFAVIFSIVTQDKGGGPLNMIGLVTMIFALFGGLASVTAWLIYLLCTR